jgi:hypothetical protein
VISIVVHQVIILHIVYNCKMRLNSRLVGLMLFGIMAYYESIICLLCDHHVVCGSFVKEDVHVCVFYILCMYNDGKKDNYI